ncbi:MAG: response regulator [Acidobacteriota bacterium]
MSGQNRELPITVLVVDDDRGSLALMAIILERDGHQIITAEDGVAGLAAFERHAPSIIITDINMPRLSGLDLIRRVRKSDGPLAHIPIIALTAGSEEVMDQAQCAGADIVARKPDDMRRLPVFIQGFFEQRYSHNAI